MRSPSGQGAVQRHSSDVVRFVSRVDDERWFPCLNLITRASVLGSR